MHKLEKAWRYRSVYELRRHYIIHCTVMTKSCVLVAHFHQKVAPFSRSHLPCGLIRGRSLYVEFSITQLQWPTARCINVGGDLNSVVCQRVTPPRGIQYWRTAIHWYISFIWSQRLHLKKWQKIK